MLDCQKSQFQLEEDIIYLNCAYMSPLMQSVAEEGTKALNQKLRPYNVYAEDFFLDQGKIRSAFSKLINSSNPDRVVTIPSVSYGMAVVAKNVEHLSGNIIITGEQFPSNVYCWKRLAEEKAFNLVTVNAPEQAKNRGQKWNESVLSAIDDETAIVSISHTHWATGTKFDLESIRKKTKEHNALLIVDGTQSVGALPFDIQKIRPDALVCAGYKWLMGPYGIGVAYFGEFFDHGKPIEENWINRKHSEDFAGLVNYVDEYQPGALRYGMGEQSSFIHVPMLLTALNQLNEWQPGRIQEYCKKISQKAVAELKTLGCIVEDEDYRGHHLFGIDLPESAEPQKVLTNLKENNIFISLRGNSIRVAPNVYNDEADFDRFVDCVRISLETGPKAVY